MTTLNQSIKKKLIKPKKKNILNNNPQVKATIIKIASMAPKKPNSANRKIAIVSLKNSKKIKAYIPGENSFLKPHAQILIRGGNVNDLPGIKYKVILNEKVYCVPNRRNNKRSKYGIKLAVGRNK